MPEVEEKKTVDIDTSGPGADIELPEEKENQEDVQINNDTSDVVNADSESSDTIAVVEEKTEDQKETSSEEKQEKELEQYSKDVKRRIAKLTGKWREAERQKDEALNYAQKMISAKKQAEERISRFEPEFFKNAEDSITSGVQAAQAKLAAAREANDLKAEAEALTTISELGYRKARLEETRVDQEEYNQQTQEPQPSPEINLNRQPRS